jgi:hypothetical protein
LVALETTEERAEQQRDEKKMAVWTQAVPVRAAIEVELSQLLFKDDPYRSIAPRFAEGVKRMTTGAVTGPPGQWVVWHDDETVETIADVPGARN